MALDAIVEIAFRIVVQFVIEVLFVGIFYWPGWLILRVITIGRYPPQQSQPHSASLWQYLPLLFSSPA
jgi:hypothetical protein